ncbi:hypothetical protein BCN_5054 [Bacillus cereus NC7401]|nr:hypothetical protein BCN_5054 [Bacillus cereus NC7401]
MSHRDDIMRTSLRKRVHTVKTVKRIGSYIRNTDETRHGINRSLNVDAYPFYSD